MADNKRDKGEELEDAVSLLSGFHDLKQTHEDEDHKPIRKKSSRGTADSTPNFGTPDFDRGAHQRMNNLDARLDGFAMQMGQIKTEMGHLDTAIEGTAQKASEIETTVLEIQRELAKLFDRSEVQGRETKDLSSLIERVALEAGAQKITATRSSQQNRDVLLAAIDEREAAKKRRLEARGDTPVAEADLVVAEKERTVTEAAIAYLASTIRNEFGEATKLLPILQLQSLQHQLTAALSQHNKAKPAAWSLRAMFTTDVNARALASVKKLARNAAFSNLDSRTTEVLKVNEQLLELMLYATYALKHFNKIKIIAAVPQPDLDPPLMQTPNRSLIQKEAGSATKAKMTATQEDAELNAAENDINRAVIDVIRVKLGEIKTKSEGLIGTQNTSLQFWGKVFMILAAAITVILAAVAVMSVLGFSAPTFLVPYLAAVQANAAISTVLNFVAAKLTLDLNAAAAATVVASAGVLGVFGKGLHMAGAPTALKRDLDKAAEHLEAALAETEAAKSTPRPSM